MLDSHQESLLKLSPYNKAFPHANELCDISDILLFAYI